MKKIEGSVTAAKGFLAAGTEAGIKYQNRKDMAMIYSEVPCISLLYTSRASVAGILMISAKSSRIPP